MCYLHKLAGENLTSQFSSDKTYLPDVIFDFRCFKRIPMTSFSVRHVCFGAEWRQTKHFNVHHHKVFPIPSLANFKIK